MKKSGLLVTIFGLFLLLVGIASAQYTIQPDADVLAQGQGGIYPQSRMLGYQRIIGDEYRNWFYEVPRPEAQRILDVNSLEVLPGELATPGKLGAQRVLNEEIAWRYGYDIERGLPLLSPYGQSRVLKREGFAGVAAELGAAQLQDRTFTSFRQRRSALMNQYLYLKRSSRLPVRYQRVRVPTTDIQSLDFLDTRPIYETEYERQSGLRAPRSNQLIRARWLRSRPGIDYTELKPIVGQGQLRSDELFRIAWLGRTQGRYVEDELVPRRIPREMEVYTADVLSRQRWLGTQTGLEAYDRFGPETQGGQPIPLKEVFAERSEYAAAPSEAAVEETADEE